MGPSRLSRWARALVVVLTAGAATLLVASPALADPASVDFGDRAVNTSVTTPVTIALDVGYHVGSLSGTGSSAPFAAAFGTCGSPVDSPGCTFDETFAPTAAGAFSGSIDVEECFLDVTPCTHVLIPVSGTGVHTFTSAPAGIDFGGVLLNTTATRSLTLTLDPGYKVTAIMGTGSGAPFAPGLDTCGAFVGPGTCTVTESFTPTTDAVLPALMRIFERDTLGTASDELDLHVSGFGGIPTASSTPAALAFPARLVGTTSPADTVTLVNTSVIAMPVSAITATGNFTVAPSSTCLAGLVVAVGGACTVDVRFTPTGSGTRSGALVITDASTTSPHLVPLSGTGIARRAAFSVTPGQLTFGSQAVGSGSPTQTVVVGNSGTAPLSFSRIYVTGDFARSGGTCHAGTAVAAGHSCTVVLRFTPHARGTRAGSLTFEDNAPRSPHSVPLAGIGR
jgi:hypothetical protein